VSTWERAWSWVIYYGLVGYREFDGLERLQIGIVTGAVMEFGFVCFLMYGVFPLLGIEGRGLESTVFLAQS
jgi:hypothetical protein